MSTTTNEGTDTCLSQLQHGKPQMDEKSTQTTLPLTRKRGRPNKQSNINVGALSKAIKRSGNKKNPKHRQSGQKRDVSPQMRKKRNSTPSQTPKTGQGCLFEPCQRCANNFYNSYLSMSYHPGMLLLAEFCRECSRKALECARLQDNT